MSYKPMTQDEAVKLNIRPDGVYPFEVLTAEAATSKEKQNPMIALSLRFFDPDGSSFTVKDWLVHSESRWSEKKFFDFVYSVGAGGLLVKYNDGTMCAEDCLGRSGFAAIGTQKGKPKADGSGDFPDRNVVKYYTTQKPKESAAAPAQDLAANNPMVRNENLDEDVPF